MRQWSSFFFIAGVLYASGLALFAGERPALEIPPPAIRASLDAGNAQAAVRAYNAWRLRLFATTRLPPVPYRDADLPLFKLPGVSPLPPGRGLRRYLFEQGFSATASGSQLLEARDQAYLERCLFLRAVALQVTAGAANDIARANRLFAFVCDEIQPRAQATDHAWPEDILIRGYGSCDQSAWVLCSLAEQIGIKSMVVFLRDPATGISYHTVAALRLGRRWQPFDTLAALDFVRAGSPPPNLLTAFVDPRPLQAFVEDGKGQCLLNAKHLPWADFLVYTDPRGALLRWDPFSKAVQTTSSGSPYFLWFNPLNRIKSLRIEFSMVLNIPEKNLAARWHARTVTPAAKALHAQPSGVRIFPYGEPTRTYALYSQPQALETIKKTRSYGIFRTARRLHLLGLPEKALEIFFKQNNRNPAADPKTNADRLYYASLSYFAAGQYAKASATLSQLRNIYPHSFWRTFLPWQEARSAIAERDNKKATVFLSRVSEPRIRAAAKLQLQLANPHRKPLSAPSDSR